VILRLVLPAAAVRDANDDNDDDDDGDAVDVTVMVSL
jgi:hypothetical protein